MASITRTDTVSIWLAVRRFAGHFLEMCVVMCMGGILLDLAVFSGLGVLGYADAPSQAPLAVMLVIGLDFTLVMAVYMYVRGHARQHNIEMSGGTLAGTLVLMAASWAGWIPQSFANWFVAFGLMCTPLCVLMFVMLARFDHYGGRIGATIAQAAAGRFTCTMHPEVRRSAPGTCPICGMTLVSRA